VLRYEYRASHIESEGGSMHTSELLGKQVLDKNGNNVGKVVDIDINLPQLDCQSYNAEEWF
jgi:sporulation protein YlmC with PRC-barrel domain